MTDIGSEIKALELSGGDEPVRRDEESITDEMPDEVLEDKTEDREEDEKKAKGDPKKKAGKPIKKEEKKDEVSDERDTRVVDGRKAALAKALATIEKDFGKGAVMRWGEKVMGRQFSVVPTGSLGLDVALGIGGLPRGRIVEIYGPEASGKTTVTLHAVAEVQRMNGICAFIDAEHALDPVYAKRLGVNIDDLYISQPDDGEQALDIAEEMVRSGAIDLVIVDSVAALTPRAEIEDAMGQSHMGIHARLMSQALRKLTAICSKSETIIIFTNQLRQNIGGYGPLDVTTGGRALKFYASVRLEIKKGEPIKEQGDKHIGNRTHVKVAKNKMAPPFKSCAFDIIFGEGISFEGDVLDIGVTEGIVYKGGSWYSYNETRLGQGRDNARIFLKENPDIAEEIANAVRTKNNMKSLDEIRNAPMREAVRLEVRPAKKKKKSNEKGGKSDGSDDGGANDDADSSED